MVHSDLPVAVTHDHQQEAPAIRQISKSFSDPNRKANVRACDDLSRLHPRDHTIDPFGRLALSLAIYGGEMEVNKQYEPRYDDSEGCNDKSLHLR